MACQQGLIGRCELGVACSFPFCGCAYACAHRRPGAQERWRLRLEDAEAGAQAKLGRARDLIGQYEDTITELSQDSSALTASAQALREDNSALGARLEAARAETEHLQAPAPSLPQLPPARLVQKPEGHATHLQRLHADPLLILCCSLAYDVMLNGLMCGLCCDAHASASAE